MTRKSLSENGERCGGEGWLAALLFSRRPARDILFRRALPFSPGRENSTRPYFQTGSKRNSAHLVLIMALGSVIAVFSANAQTWFPGAWVNDPFCLNTNFTVTRAQSGSPDFMNNGVQRGTLYANSPIGAKVTLENPGDLVVFSGRVTLTGGLNKDGHQQFRVGLYYQGDNRADTNWLGYTVGNVTGISEGAATCLMVRNNPNPGIYASGASGSVMRPQCDEHDYTPGWDAGTYDFSLSVMEVSTNCQKVLWKLMSTPPDSYRLTGTYTNNVAPTEPPAFDEVGIMGGAALFQSASVEDGILFTNLSVTLTKQGAIR